MFEKYSDRARQVIFLARMKAGQRGAASIEVNDLLAAIVIEDQGDFRKAVSEGRDSRDVIIRGDPSEPSRFLPSTFARELLGRLESENCTSSPIPNSEEMALSDGFKHTLVRAAVLCEEMRQNQVEPMHLLAAILEDDSSQAAQFFRYAGITRENVLAYLRGET